MLKNLRKDNKNIPIILLGNKSDLDDERKINEEKGKKKAEEFKIFFSEISAKKEENIKNVFEKLMKKILEVDKKDIIEENQNNENKKCDKCCSCLK